jgi:cathepsin D
MSNSDTWVTASNCTCTSTDCSSCVAGSSWDPSSSSTYARRGKILQISYGSGIVTGWTANDVSSLGGFTISDQVIGVVDNAARVLPGDVEGLMGLAFGYIARAGGTPWWLRVLNGEGGAAADGGVISFWLSRYATLRRKLTCILN